MAACASTVGVALLSSAVPADTTTCVTALCSAAVCVETSGVVVLGTAVSINV